MHFIQFKASNIFLLTSKATELLLPLLDRVRMLCIGIINIHHLGNVLYLGSPQVTSVK